MTHIHNTTNSLKCEYERRTYVQAATAKAKARQGNMALIHAFYYKLAKNMTVTYCTYTNVFETINNEIHILIYEIHSTISL